MGEGKGLGAVPSLLGNGEARPGSCCDTPSLKVGRTSWGSLTLCEGQRVPALHLCLEVGSEESSEVVF